MKRIPLLFAFVFLSSHVQANVIIDLFAGKLLMADGTTAMPNGTLIQLIASTTDSTFTAPNTSSFTGGSADDIVVSSYVMNSSTGGGAGLDLQAITFSYSGNFNQGDPLLLRW